MAVELLYPEFTTQPPPSPYDDNTPLHWQFRRRGELVDVLQAHENEGGGLGPWTLLRSLLTAAEAEDFYHYLKEAYPSS
jgi:hypothetical protein